MQRTGAEEVGIDLFDFLVAVWRSKWLFLAIVASCLLAGLAAHLLRGPSSSSVSASAYQAKVEFSLAIADDPFQRTFEAILSDFLAKWTADPSLELSNAETEQLGITMKRHTYRVDFSEGANVGVIRITAPEAPLEYFDRAYAAMQNAALAQVEELKQQVRADLETIANIRRETYTADSEVLATKIFMGTMFLRDPNVQDGTRRFVLLDPIQMGAPAPVGGAPVTSLSRRLFIAGLVGLLAASMAVVVRIAHQRRRRAAAADAAP